jgi:hypothetical protein
MPDSQTCATSSTRCAGRGSGHSSPWVIAISLTAAAALYAVGDRTGCVGSWRRGSIWEGHQRRYPVRMHGHEPAHQPQRDTAHRSQDGRDEKPSTAWRVAERGPRDGALTRSLDHPASRTSPAQSTHGWRVGHAEGQPTRRESQGVAAVKLPIGLRPRDLRQGRSRERQGQHRRKGRWGDER